jgi:hypothetical protein
MSAFTGTLAGSLTRVLAATLAGSLTGVFETALTAVVANGFTVVFELAVLTEFTGALTVVLADDLAGVFTWVSDALEAGDFFTAAARVALADGLGALTASGIFAAALCGALAAAWVLTADGRAALGAVTLTDDLRGVFTSCLLAVQLTRTLCASPSHRTLVVHLHQNPVGKTSGAGGVAIRHPVRAAIVATGQVKSGDGPY